MYNTIPFKFFGVSMLSRKFVEEQRHKLVARRKSKLKILEKGGEQALSHSPRDITRIDFAMKRIEAQQYGICTDCGFHIGEDRLRVIPETPFCTSCATRLEAQ